MLQRGLSIAVAQRGPAPVIHAAFHGDAVSVGHIYLVWSHVVRIGELCLALMSWLHQVVIIVLDLELVQTARRLYCLRISPTVLIWSNNPRRTHSGSV